MNGRKKERAADIVEEVLDASRIGRGQAREAQRSMKRRRSSQLPERQALVDTRALSIQSATLNSSRNTQWEIVHQNELRKFARSLLAHFKASCGILLREHSHESRQTSKARSITGSLLSS